MEQAVASAFGVKVVPHNVEAGLMWHVQDHKRVFDALKLEAFILGAMLGDGRITQESFDSEMAGLSRKMREVNDDMQPYIDGLEEWRRMQSRRR